jgi:hypothetical protein
MKRLPLVLAPSLLAIAACSSEDVENTSVDDVDELVNAEEEYDPMTREYTLSEDAQARRDAFDSDADGDEYGRYRDEIRAEQDTEESMAAEREREQMAMNNGGSGNRSTNASGGTSASASSDSGGSGSQGSAASSANGSGSGSAMPTRDASTNMRRRSEMTWSYLDRNDDGQLSVAEYAIWAIPLDPTEPEPNDALPPYVEAEEINKAADSFFYYDRDGDTYLSQREFTSARRGENFDN